MQMAILKSLTPDKFVKYIKFKMLPSLRGGTEFRRGNPEMVDFLDRHARLISLARDDDLGKMSGVKVFY